MKFVPRTWIFIGLLILMIAGLIGQRLWQRDYEKKLRKQNEAQPLELSLKESDIITLKAQRQKVKIEVTGELKPTDEALVTAEVSARIRTLLVEEGDFVNAGQLLATLDDDDLVQQEQAAIRDLESSRASASLSAIELARGRESLAAGLIPQSELDSVSTNHIINEQQVERLKAELRLRQSAKLKAQVKSPMSGIVSKKSVKTGQLVSPGMQMFEIVQIDPLKVILAVPSNVSQVVQLNQQVEVHIDSYPNIQFRGRIVRINPTADAATRSILMTVEVPNPNNKIKANLFASCTIVLSETDEIITLPREAVQELDNAHWAYVYDSEGLRLLRTKVEVEPIGTDNLRYIATAGLQTGDRVLNVIGEQRAKVIRAKLVPG